MCREDRRALAKYQACSYGQTAVVKSSWIQDFGDVIGCFSVTAMGEGVDIYNGGGGIGVPMYPKLVKDRYHDKPSPLVCPVAVGNPIYPLTASKGLKESLGRWRIGGREVTAVYDTRRQVPVNDSGLAFSAAAAPSFGEPWSTSLHKRLVLQTSGWRAQAIQASRGSGGWVSFVNTGSGYVADADVPDRLLAIPGGWRYVDSAAQSQETYDGSGKLLSVSYASGATLAYAYSDTNTAKDVAPEAGLLLSVRDGLGRSVQFRYEHPEGASAPRIKEIIDPLGNAIGVVYDGNNFLTRLDWPDHTSRQYLYERTDIPWAVTGTVDENASRLATYGYDAEGRANDTQWAGGADHYNASYSQPPGWEIVESYDPVADIIWRDHYWRLAQDIVVTLPDGSTSKLTAALVQGTPRLTSQSQPAGSGCVASMREQTYDANGNAASSIDMDGNQSCFSSDPHTNLQLVKVEGLARSTACDDVTKANAVLPADSRKTSTAWHPDWRLATQIAEPGGVTTRVYNGQPDPTAGGAKAVCAPSAAILPDGKPIAVLCKQIEQATTDADGHLGFTATPQAGVAARTQHWTYDEHGQVLSERDSLDNHTSYSYYTDTAFDSPDPDAPGHTIGDLMTSTNSAGEVTNYRSYNRSGQLLLSVGADGATTSYRYDARQRLLSTRVGDETTSFTYDAAGQLQRVTAPNQGWAGFEYDAAHRRTAATDDSGNRIEFDFDSSGKSTLRSVKDPGGRLARSTSQLFDALERLQLTTGQP